MKIIVTALQHRRYFGFVAGGAMPAVHVFCEKLHLEEH
jgi:hypothetical protein